MAEFTLRENADRYLLGEITLDQLYDYVDADIIEDFRYGERDREETALAAFIFGAHIDYKASCEARGYEEEEEFRQELAAHFYMEQLTSAQTKTKVKTAAS